MAGGLEYRRGIARYLDWTIGWMYEGSPGPINHYGITTQICPKRFFFDDRVSLGAGLGVYFAIDTRREEHGEGRDTLVAGLLSFSASYRLGSHLLTRATFNRTITGYDKDTDVLLIGLGYRF